ncbi:MAG: helix-turn-helix domain-containing protein [Thermoflexales bacterium]|nr:helix-turn-helix domain-containing protein [Thermoflexales bacterium]
MAKSKEAMGNLITAREAAALLGVSGRTVLRLIASGDIEGVQLASRDWVVNRDSLEGYTPKKRGRKPKDKPIESVDHS